MPVPEGESALVSQDGSGTATVPEAVPARTEVTLTRRTIHAARWRSASLLAQAVLQVGLGIALARLLSPADFGLATIALVVVGFASMLADLGLSSAVVYRHPLTERHIRASFTLSMLASVLLTLTLAALAPYVAGVLRNGALRGVLRVEAVLFIFTAIGATARSLLRRGLDFRRLFLVEVGSYFAGYVVVALTLALLGFGVWSLVCGVLVQALLASGLAIGVTRHPVRPLLAMAESRDLLGYGGTATLNGTINFAAGSADSFVIGRWLGTSELGLYNRAFNVIVVPLAYLGNIMTSVLFPVMSSIRNDPERLRTAYFLAVQSMVLLSAPLCAGVIVAAPHLIVGLYGEEWRSATIPLQILAAAGVLRTVYHLAAAVTYASNNVMAEVRRQAVLTLLVLAGGMVGASWGLPGVSLAVVVGIGFMYFAMAHLSLQIVGGAWRVFFAAHLPGLTVALAVSWVALGVRWLLEERGVGSLWILVAIILSCIATLPVAIYFLPRRLRPVDLFARFHDPISRLPISIGLPLVRILRLET